MTSAQWGGEGASSVVWAALPAAQASVNRKVSQPANPSYSRTPFLKPLPRGGFESLCQLHMRPPEV